MKESNRKAIKILMKLLVVMMWVVCIYGIYRAIPMYEYVQEHPQKEYQSKIFGEVPEEAQIKIDMYYELKNIVLVGLFFVALHIVLDYFYDPKNHFAVVYGKKIEKFMNKHGSVLEDDLEDEKDETRPEKKD